MIKTFFQIFKVELKLWTFLLFIMSIVFSLVLLGAKIGELLGLWNVLDF